MKYGREDKNGVCLIRDCYAEQFADPGDLKYNYIIELDGNCIDECADPQKLSKRLTELAKSLIKVANFLSKKKF